MGEETLDFEDAFDKAEGTVEEKVDEVQEPPKEEIKEEIKEEPTEPVKEEPKEEIKDEEAKFEQRWKSLQGIYNHDKEVWEAERRSLAEQLENLKAQEPKQEPKQEKKDTIQNLYDSLTDEQKESIKEYDEEFDIVSKMEGMKRDIALKRLREDIDAFKAEILSQLAPTQDFIKESKEEREVRLRDEHFGKIAKEHPDYEKYRDDGSIIKWIETKPRYIQKSLLETYKQGTADDIVDLLTDFKTENNITVAERTPDVKKEQKKKAMAAVTSKRGAVNASMTVPDDFEGAFEEAINR